MKTQYVADDGKVFDEADDCRAYEVRLGMQKTGYAIRLDGMSLKTVLKDAREYAKWLRAKQTYPATDSGEHHCCDLMEEMAKRLS